MADGRISISKSPEPFTVLPRSFLQSKTLSPHSIAVGVYLASQVETWKPHPLQIQAHFRFGDSVWRRVSKELKEEGYMTETKGGHGKGGTDLQFDIWKNLRQKADQPLPKTQNSDPLKIRPSENPTLGKSTPLDNRDLLDNRDSINNNNADVVLLDEEMRSLRGPEKLRREFLSTYSADRIKMALKITRFNEPERPWAYFKNALVKGFVLNEKPRSISIVMQEQTTEAIERLNKATIGAGTTKSKKARDEAMRMIKRINK